MNLKKILVSGISNWSLYLLFLFTELSVASQETMTIHLQSTTFQSALKSINAEKVTIDNDPIYGRVQHYVGYKLLHVLAVIGVRPRSGMALRFHCKDGFKAIVQYDKSDFDQAFLASKVLTVHAGLPMDNIREGKSLIDPAPFSLVWTAASPNNKDNPWPFGVESIEVGGLSDFLGYAYPTKSPQVVSGYKLFVEKCSSCHSINMQGGSLGPELNIPKNVTEYWSKEHFVKFVENPQTYRYKSRMAVDKIPHDNILEIYAYIRAMMKEKVCNDINACRKWEAEYKNKF